MHNAVKSLVSHLLDPTSRSPGWNLSNVPHLNNFIWFFRVYWCGALLSRMDRLWWTS